MIVGHVIYIYGPGLMIVEHAISVSVCMVVVGWVGGWGGGGRRDRDRQTDSQSTGLPRAWDYLVYLERLSYLVIELFTPYTGATFASARRVSPLDHKPLYISMKYGAIIVAACA